MDVYVEFILKFFCVPKSWQFGCGPAAAIILGLHENKLENFCQKSVFGKFYAANQLESLHKPLPPHRTPQSFFQSLHLWNHCTYAFFVFAPLCGRFTKAPFNINFANRPHRTASKWTVMRGKLAAAAEAAHRARRIFPARPRNRARVYWSYPNHRNFV